MSLGTKVYLKDLIKWLNFYNTNKLKIIKLPKNANKDCFYLNNSKLISKINIKIQLDDLKNYCKKLSKYIFKNK